ncbi:MAG: beta-hexosaminidase [Oscillospiraceae bacterium]|nr:beta-hexosaminidase [Oscillospiraceae bacterium]
MHTSKLTAALLAAVLTAGCTGCGTTDITTNLTTDQTQPAATSLVTSEAVSSAVPETTASLPAAVSSAAASTSAAASVPGSTTSAASVPAVTTAAQNNGGGNSYTQPAKTQVLTTPLIQTAAPVTSVSTAQTSAVTTTTSAPRQFAVLAGIDADLVERASKMSLHEKISQMMMGSAADVSNATKAVENGVGALCLFAKAFSGKSKEQVKQMTASFQKAAKTPLLICIDEEGGTVNRVSTNKQLRAVPFWSPRDLFETGGFDLVVSDEQEKADLLLSLGVNSNLGPVCDIALSEKDYIYNRTVSMNPDITSEYVKKIVETAKEKHLATTLKHFPGYGGSRDTHKNMATDTRPFSEFETRDLLPFKAGIAAGADSVMVAHNIVECLDKELPASLSPAVHKLLREDLGFTGVIITDDLGMNAITQFTNGKNPAVAAVLAGNDFLCYADYANSVPAVEKAIKAGEISEDQIDYSVQRILQWKRNIGIL